EHVALLAPGTQEGAAVERAVIALARGQDPGLVDVPDRGEDPYTHGQALVINACIRARRGDVDEGLAEVVVAAITILREAVGEEGEWVEVLLDPDIRAILEPYGQWEPIAESIEGRPDHLLTN